MPKCADTDKQKISQYRWLLISEPIIGATLPFCGLSPAELSMGHKFHTDLPQPQQNLLSEWSYIDEFAEKHKKFKADQKRHYDKRHRV